MSILFSPLLLGEYTLPNRIIMAPLTRSRATETRVPTAAMAQYYADRASAGLILTEATAVCPMGVGYANTPGIWSLPHVHGWKTVTDAVHQRRGRIFLQLWHVGRISDPYFLNGALPVAPSAIAARGKVSLLTPPRPFVTPRALELEEIPGIVAAYRQGAEYAQQAGFDGVEIHAANGYLLDQFLQDSTNQRHDNYGGSIPKRARLLLEVVDAAIAVWGAGRVGVHLAPRGDAHDMGDSAPVETFSYVAHALGQRKIAFIFGREAQGPGYIGDVLKKHFGGVYIANQGLDQTSAAALIQAHQADAVAFGKLFIANPDLPRRFALQAALNTPDPDTFYVGGERGYNDYPSLTT